MAAPRAQTIGGDRITLLVTGPPGDRTVAFTAVRGCRSTIELVPGTLVNASADGGRVIIGAGLLARCRRDDDPALVIAHELAHNLLHHAARLGLGGGAPGLFGTAAAGTAAMRATEEEADQLGAQLAMTASYDLRGAGRLLDGLQAHDAAPNALSTHPAPDRRLALPAVAIERARAMPAGAVPTLPQFVSTANAPALAASTRLHDHG